MIHPFDRDLLTRYELHPSVFDRIASVSRLFAHTDFDLRPFEDPTRVAEEVETCDLHKT